MAEELKPCPFCAGTALMFKVDGSQGLKWGSVVCCDCESAGPMVRTGYDTSDKAPWHEGATKEWNTRVEPSEFAAMEAEE